MSLNYTLNYRTFDTLLADVNSDMSKYHLDDSIQAHQLIKVANRVTYKLGLRIYQTKETVLELNKGRVKLPNDFYVMNHAFICGEKEYSVPYSQGTHIEERPVGEAVPAYQQWPTDVNLCGTEPEELDPNCPCDNPPACPSGTVYSNCQGNEFELVQIIKSEKRVYKTFYPLKLKSGSQSVDCNCPNLYMSSPDEVWIKDGWLYSSFKEGMIYFNYQGMLVNKDNEVLVPDHPLLNEYYEYALKERIQENLIINDIPVSDRAVQLVKQKLRESHNNALSLVNMPGYTEMRKVYEANRKAQYSKYYDMFAGLKWSNWTGDFGNNITRR